MDAEKSVKFLEISQASLTLTIDADTLEKAYQEKLGKYAKTIQIDGFRKGKVPASVVERKYGEMIREESSFDAMEKYLQDTIQTLDFNDKPLAFSTPVLQDEEKLLPFKKGEDVTYTVVYDIYPRFELPEYKGLEVEVPSVEVTDADIDKEVERKREQNSVVRTKDGAAENGDIVTVDYAEIGEDGNPVASTERKGFVFTIGSGYNFYKIDNDVIGMKKGEEKTVEKTYTAEDHVPGYDGKTVKLHIALTEVKYRELPEVNDELAQDIKEEYKTVADLKAGIRKDFESQVEERMKNDKINALLDAIKAKTEITIPASMLAAELENAWRNFYHQSGLTEEQILSFLKMQGSTKEALLDEWKDSCTANLKDQLILDAIKDKEDFAVSDEEFKEEWEKNYKSVKDEDKEYYENILRDSLKFAKVTPFLLENNTFKAGKKVSYDDFIAGAYKEEE